MMQNHRVGDGTLLPDDFHDAAQTLSTRWKQTCPTFPQWNWIPHRLIPIGASCNDHKEGYLSLENVYLQNSNKDVVDDRSVAEREEPFDSATLIQSHNDEAVYDFHIVYNFSYRVPVLYFRGYKCGGQPLALDDIQRDLPCYSSSILKESKWTFITQEEHPYLHRPWYTLHPCGTAEWMSLLCRGTTPGEERGMARYLSAWLSVVGQVVGLRVPLELQSARV